MTYCSFCFDHKRIRYNSLKISIPKNGATDVRFSIKNIVKLIKLKKMNSFMIELTLIMDILLWC